MTEETVFMSIRVPVQLREIIRARAQQNLRTSSAEALFLIELGLTAGDEDMRRLVKLAEFINQEGHQSPLSPTP
ncbi:hypothetical protein QBC99_002494 [Beijerinckia sp. GAS462]|uniref:hypothetical protein n=1 Tax=Beijerinckia sp. GAS462 TaxID=3039852 RepID=UPI0008956ECE|nr:hypothetical protein [Beijerinckia sp. GAS462]MDH7796431.1 hypothetical protein [Beijerinckia sp. GAS462]SEC44787.1 hypothetical protein SAMN05443249_2713 [Beijerinckia sp. 28-YEA-48]